MPDPFFLILALIAIACVILFPIRVWRQKRHRYGEDAGGGDTPLAPPDARDRD